MSLSVELERKAARPHFLHWPAPAATLAAITWLVIALGAILRLARWIHWRALWLDEIYLANSILHRSLHDLLLKPLDDWQAAPPGFLALEHLAVRLFGSGERSLRLISLLFGLASLPLMLAVAKRLLRPLGACIAVAMFVFLGPLIYYSNEVKPYACDVVFSLAITLTVLRWLDDKTIRRAIAAAIAGAAGVFFSYPSVFVLAGFAALLLCQLRGSAIRQFLPICLIWGLAFIMQFVIFIWPVTHGEAHPHLVQYWIAQKAFMPTSPGAALTWVFWNLHCVAQDPGSMWLEYPDAALVGLVIGAVIAIRRRNFLLVLLAPLPVVLLASAMKQYPFAERLALFFVPQYLLLIALAVDSLWTNLAGKTAALVIAGLIVLPSASRAVHYLISPPGREESLPAYRWVAGHWRSGDELYLNQFAQRSFDYYRSRSGLPQDMVVHIQPAITQPSQVYNDVKTLAGHRRVWVVLIHAEDWPFDLRQFTVAALDDIGLAVQKHSEDGAMVYLYDCSSPPVESGRLGQQ